jgi:CSLREA domain-containing protein
MNNRQWLFRLLAPLALASASAAANDIRVTKFTDSLDGACNSDCSLREAVQLANELPGPDRILLRAGVYVLTLPPDHDDDLEPLDEDANANGDLDVVGDLTISGAGIDATRIDAGGIDRVLEVLPGASVYLRTLAITGGHASDIGGGIHNRGALTIWSTATIGNDASSQAHRGIGGGIANDGGVLSVYASLIDGNVSHPREVSFGRGGGIFSSGVLTVRETTISNNSTDDDDDFARGGGIYNTGTADIARSAFTGNVAPYGSAFSNGQGGVATLSNVTVSGNTTDPTSYFGAAVGNDDTGASAGNPSRLKLSYTTIAANSGWGVSNSGRVDVRDTIVSGNALPSSEDANCASFGTYTHGSALLGSQSPQGCEGDLMIANGDTFTRLLFALADNGGRTATHALRLHALAIDAAAGNCPAQDQRSSSRPRDGDGDGIAVCDIGAYERSEP